MKTKQRGEIEIFLAWLVVVMILFTMSWTVAYYFVPESRAVRTVESQGFTDARVTDKAVMFIGFRGCDGKDAVRFTVSGKNPQGKDVQVFVCAGYFKGGTIRDD